MTLPSFAARRDANEAEIVDMLETLGFAVECVSQPGHPDLVLSRAGRWYLAEVKSAKGRETDAQVRFRRAAKAPVPIFRELDDVLDWERELSR